MIRGRTVSLMERNGEKLKRGLAIAGFMGSGKTTLAEHFAAQVDARFLDLDDLVESSLDMSIRQIFKRKGEAFFRRAEYKELVSLHSNQEPYVLALGGGTPFVNGAAALLETHVLVWFRLGWKVLAARLFNHESNRNKRPLAISLSQAQDLYQIREELFQKMYGDWTLVSLNQPHNISHETVLEPKVVWTLEQTSSVNDLSRRLFPLWRSITQVAA